MGLWGKIQRGVKRSSDRMWYGKKKKKPRRKKKKRSSRSRRRRGFFQ